MKIYPPPNSKHLFNEMAIADLGFCQLVVLTLERVQQMLTDESSFIAQNHLHLKQVAFYRDCFRWN